MTRVKLAELTSGIGAVVLGIGLGALLARWVGVASGAVTVVGVLLHGFGMWDKHRLEAGTPTAGDRTVVALYWVCWLLLAGVLIYLVV
jgi:hypothetical protein